MLVQLQPSVSTFLVPLIWILKDFNNLHFKSHKTSKEERKNASSEVRRDIFYGNQHLSPSPSLLSLLYSPLSENFQTDRPASTNQKPGWDSSGQSEERLADSRCGPVEKSLW